MTSKYITTPIYYVNGLPHIGHAHTSIMGDILKRFSLMQGIPTLYSTGTDEHGQKIQQVIEQSGQQPEVFLAAQAKQFRDLFDRCNVAYDVFVRTTDSHHKTLVREILQNLYDRNLIVKKQYTGLYCIGCEQFKTEGELDAMGRCKDHLTPPQKQTETNYFFDLEKHRSWLIDWLKQSDQLIQPESYRREILGMLNEPLEDLCISRPKSRVWHGIELPFDPDFVAYVWFDALLNYVSNIGYGHSDKFDFWWSNVMHIMAKDIIKTHLIYWPIMLRAIGIDPPKFYRIHGYWVGEGGQKMSKSLGNVVDPYQIIDAISVDALRYYLAKNMGGGDAQISKDLIESTYNTDLANNIGNLHSRVLKFVFKRCEGKVPEPIEITDDDNKLGRFVADKLQHIVNTADLLTLPETIKTLLQIADRLNTHYNDVEPWKLVKDDSQRTRFLSICYTMLDCLHMYFRAFYPIIPETAEKALQSLGLAKNSYQENASFIPGTLKPGTLLGEIHNLFPRIE